MADSEKDAMKPMRIAQEFYSALPVDLYDQLKTFLLADSQFWLGCDAISFPRYGQSRIWDFHCDTEYVSCPQLSHPFYETFSQVTDQRAIELKDAMQQRNRELAVFWSGGIDSTLVLSAIIKNFQADELKHVTVIANDRSYFENPVFFHQAIERYQLKTVNFTNFSNTMIQQLFDKYLVTDGEPADKLWISQNCMQFEAKYGHGLLEKSYKSTADKMIEFMSDYMPTARANIYYKYLIQNIEETGAEIETLGDLFWWINFNFHWVEHLLIWYYQFPIKNFNTYRTYKQNYMPWYHTDAYQLWSRWDRPKKLVFDRHELYKFPAKQYIHDVVKDTYSLNYKSKLASPKKPFLEKVPASVVILADGSVLDHSDSGTLEKFISQYCLVR